MSLTGGEAAGPAGEPGGGDAPAGVAVEPLSGPSSRPMWPVWLGIGATVLIVVVAVVLILGGRSTSYSEADRQAFMSACTAGGGEPVRGTCGCIFDQMASKVPYSRYVEVDQDLANQRANGGTVKYPSDVEAIRVDCVNRSTPR